MLEPNKSPGKPDRSAARHCLAVLVPILAALLGVGCISPGAVYQVNPVTPEQAKAYTRSTPDLKKSTASTNLRTVGVSREQHVSTLNGNLPAWSFGQYCKSTVLLESHSEIPSDIGPREVTI